MPGARRTLSRIQNATPTVPHPNRQKDARGGGDGDRLGSPATSGSLLSQPRHAHIPDIAVDSNLMFETMVLAFSVCALGLQYVHLYKTVWWLPHSHANYALNFYLIDPYLSGLLVLIMARRLVWVFVTEVWVSPGRCSFWLAALVKGALLLLLAAAASYCTYAVVLHHSLLYSLFLCYPLVTYAVLFGFQLRPLFGKMVVAPAPERAPATPGTPKHKLFIRPDYQVMCKEIPLHSCSMSPEAIRDEVDHFKTDFNNRIKQVLFNSMLVAYYMGFVPLCFAQNTVYYEAWWASQHVVLVWISAFCMFMIHFLPPKYIDQLHRCSLHLGRWVKFESRHGAGVSAHVPYNAESSKKGSSAPREADGKGPSRWSELSVWPEGALVKHVRGLFKADGSVNNSAEPGNAMHARFYFMFSRPLRVIHWLLVLTLALVGYQFALLVQASVEWSHIVSLTLLLFSNCYALFKLLRDRWVLLKCYKDDNSGATTGYSS